MPIQNRRRTRGRRFVILPETARQHGFSKAVGNFQELKRQSNKYCGESALIRIEKGLRDFESDKISHNRLL
jgi:hypothetical protein